MDFTQLMLAGRRGRYVLACLALRGESADAQELQQAVWNATARIERDRGEEVTRLVMVAEGADAQAEVSDSEMPLEDIASLIVKNSVHPMPGAVDLRKELADSAANAMYWQPPEGNDALFAEPQLIDALRQIAEDVVGSGAYQGWQNRAQETAQWMVSWSGDGSEGTWQPGLKPAAEQLASWKNAVEASETGSARDLKRKLSKVGSGNWWSNPPGGLYRSYSRPDGTGPLGLDCVEDSFGWSQATIQRLSIEATKPVFEITEPEDWASLCREFPQDVSGMMRGNWYQTTGRDGLWVQPDWQAVAQKFDGVHLSLGAYLAGAGEVIPVSRTHASVIAGWTPDETFWFTDAVQRVGGAEDWEINEDSELDEWQQVNESTQ